jgi:hypothetical protein
MSFGRMQGKRRTKYGLSTHITGETGFKDGAKAEEEDKTAGDKL